MPPNWIAIVLALVCGALPAAATDQATEEEQAAALAKAVQNPIAALATLPLQANYNLGVGEYDRTQFNLNVQPVIPFSGKKWNIITRTIIPINSIPVGETGAYFGMGDATMTLFVSPAKPGGLIWGAGPIIGIPSATNSETLGSGKWGLGPALVALAQPGKWTIGGLVNNVWSVPWGLQISKVTKFAKQPVNLLLGYYYNATHPDGGAESQVRFQLNFMYPIPQ